MKRKVKSSIDDLDISCFMVFNFGTIKEHLSFILLKY